MNDRADEAVFLKSTRYPYKNMKSVFTLDVNRHGQGKQTICLLNTNKPNREKTCPYDFRPDLTQNLLYARGFQFWI